MLGGVEEVGFRFVVEVEFLNLETFTLSPFYVYSLR